MKFNIKNFIFLKACLLGIFKPVSADMAPPAQPPGSLPEPTSETMVQMAAETVDNRYKKAGCF